MATIGKLFVATLLHGNPHINFLDAVLRFAAHYDHPWTFKHRAGDGIGKARDLLVSDFLASNATHLLFWDCDMGFDGDSGRAARSVRRMVEHGLDMVGACYPLKNEEQELVVYRLDGSPGPGAEGLEECWAIGTGFVLFRRRVFERLRDATPEQAWRDDEGKARHHFFNSRVEDGKLWSEDIAFCRDWRKIGGKIHLDHGVKLNHSGGKTYKLEGGATT